MVRIVRQLVLLNYNDGKFISTYPSFVGGGGGGEGGRQTRSQRVWEYFLFHFMPNVIFSGLFALLKLMCVLGGTICEGGGGDDEEGAVGASSGSSRLWNGFSSIRLL
jgi:hypothetical protein